MNALETMQSPNKASCWTSNLPSDASHRTFSPASPLTSLPARSSLSINSSAVLCKVSFSSLESVNCLFKPATRSMTILSSAFASLRLFCLASSLSWARLRVFLLGSTSLNTSAYIFMACTHWQSAPAASETFPTALGVKLGSLVYFSIFRSVVSLMLSLSKFLILGRNCTSFSSCLACAQDGVFSMTVITAHSVFMTISGGFAYALTSAMDFLSSFSRASIADSRAGMAFSRSRVASSAMIFVSLASFSIFVDSSMTFACWMSALARSFTMMVSNSPHSTDLTSQIFCFASRSMLISATCVRASSSLLRPLRNLSAWAPSCFCLEVSNAMYPCTNSK
mmetsp:Transcript_14483/g.50913  ORF Transcript_14483/g.50913 Transcript_14483/m.50913 type:complete len:337 (+) Transcript_14483:3378-4388(+)